jgi:cysteinyl-tRNA synthetase
MLSVHYRHPINYSVDLLESTKNAFDRLQTSYTNLQHRSKSSSELTDDNEKWLGIISEQRNLFTEAMDDDFNTANAISVLFELSRQANYYLQEKNTSQEVILAFTSAFDELGAILGLKFGSQDLLDAEIEELIEQRIQARKDRNFKLSDEIRDKLKEMNIILEDTPQGTRWKRG